MANSKMGRRRQRIDAALGLIVLSLLVLSASQHRETLLRHRRLASGEHEESSVWSFLRRLNPLPKEEVNAIIFERHDFPYPDKEATFSPRPTLSPAPGGSITSAPTLAGPITQAPTSVGLSTLLPTVVSSPPVSLPTVAPGTIAPTSPSETVQEFLTRTLTDDGALTTPGTPQNQAYTYFTTSYPAITTVDSDEVRAFFSTVYSLSVVYYSTGGTTWRDRTGWVGPTPPFGIQGSDAWVGVSCTDTVIQSLVLPENDLLGALPSEIRGLSTLKELSLGSNSLTGSIPFTIGEMTNLTTLDLGENFLFGSIPATIGDAISLETLSLDVNQITGLIPSEVNQLGNLRSLQLNGNLLEGTIPPLTLASLGKLI